MFCVGRLPRRQTTDFKLKGLMFSAWRRQQPPVAALSGEGAEREEGQRLVFTRRVDSSVFSSGRVLTGADWLTTLQSNHGTVPLSTRQYRHV